VRGERGEREYEMKRKKYGKAHWVEKRFINK
jgi:hypothetical protein